MSEWEEFSAYKGIIADAKREEREQIVEALRKLALDLFQEGMDNDNRQPQLVRYSEGIGIAVQAILDR